MCSVVVSTEKLLYSRQMDLGKIGVQLIVVEIGLGERKK
jgi:hypothetical protein